MHAFEYHKPSSSKDAVSLASKKSEARYLAGGQSLVQAMKLRLSSPSDLIDLGASKDLTGIRVSGSTVEIGAMARHAEVAGSAEVKKAIPALASLAGQIGDRQVRHMGTMGGSLANNDPAADYPAALVALKATVVTNRREVAAEEFFTGMFETALDDDEIVTAVRFAKPKRAGYAKFPNPASRYAMAGVFVADYGSGEVRVAVTGAGDKVFRVEAMEQALAKDFSAQAIAAITVPADACLSDMHASAEYRAHLVNVMAKRAVAAAG
mgnify:CR=1 FL=1